MPALLRIAAICACLSWAGPQDAVALTAKQANAAILNVIFSPAGEELAYEVSWSGGVKIGDLRLHVGPVANDSYAIKATMKATGPLSFLYPVDDFFHCQVAGALKLPTVYEVYQQEGLGKRSTTRRSWYDQEKQSVQYQKNNEAVESFTVIGPVYNEFAAFFISRALRFEQHATFMVPTFADKKRHEVRVLLKQRQTMQTIFGSKEVLQVQPQLRFKGLYEKSGDTLLWLTDDGCRIPVLIRSRIALGALEARLVAYRNPACKDSMMEMSSAKP